MNDNKIDFVAHDEIPYTSADNQDIYANVKERGMFVATERTEGMYQTGRFESQFSLLPWEIYTEIITYDVPIDFFFVGVSTSDIVARIVKDYDLYVRRNLARGYSAKELNVSFLKEKKFRFQNKMDELKDKGKRVMNEVKGDIITKWEEKSRDFIETFLLLFGRDSITNIWDKSKGRLMQALSPPGSPNPSPRGSPCGSQNGEDCDKESTSSSESDSPRAKRSACTNSPFDAVSRNTRSTASNKVILESEEEEEQDGGIATQHVRKHF